MTEPDSQLSTYEKVYLKSDADGSNAEKLEAARKKLRNRRIQLFVNCAIILLIGITYFYGLGSFDDLFYYILFGVFTVNIGLLTFQFKHLNLLIDSYEESRGID